MDEKNITSVFSKEKLKVTIATNRSELGIIAAENVSKKISKLLCNQETVRMIFAAAPSQDEFLESFCASNIEWNRISAFHMDEYVGLKKDAPQLFGRYLEDHLISKVNFKSFEKINSQAEDLEKECERYSQLLSEIPIDIVCMGIGENGHIAFNDPGVANFDDKKLVKIVELDEACRIQQVNDGCFASFREVPVEAITLTVPALMSAKHLSIVVPGIRKAEAVKNTIYGAINESCPASILRMHPDAELFLDLNSAARLE